MNLEQLKSFSEIAKTGNFTRAAANLHLTQPSLSRQIAALEQSLSSQLFHRSRGSIALTDAGEALLPLAQRMLADAESVRQEMQQLAGLRRGRVRLGATPSLCVSLVAETLSVFHEDYPGIDLHVSERGSRGIIEELVGGTLDLALVTTSEHREGSGNLHWMPLLTEELIVVQSSHAPIARDAAAVTLAELAELPQIQFHGSYDLRVTVQHAFHEAGLQPTVVLEGTEMDAALRFVERGIGVAVVPAMVAADRAGLSRLRLEQPRLSRTISLAHRGDRPLSTAATAMRDILCATAEALAADMSAVTEVRMGPLASAARDRPTARDAHRK